MSTAWFCRRCYDIAWLTEPGMGTHTAPANCTSACGIRPRWSAVAHLHRKLMLRASSRDALSTKLLCTSDAALYLVDVSNLHQQQLMNNGPEALDRLIELVLEQDSCNDVTNSYAMK